MYAILVSIALAIYTLILVDFSLLFNEISVNADIVTATQALYSAEGAIESTLSVVGDSNSFYRNLVFKDEADNETNNQNDMFLTYNEEANSFYLKRQMKLNESDLNVADAFNPNNRTVRSEAYLSDGQSMDQKSYYGLEPRSARGFVLRETPYENNFNEIIFEYDKDDEASDIVFEVFTFPREGGDVDFQNFENIKNGFPQSVGRVVINTRDSSQDGYTFLNAGYPLSVDFGGYSTGYNKQIRISGFNPINQNYILHFQTLDNQPIHFKLAATYQGQPVMLPSMMQAIDVIGATQTGLYQRVKFQRETEEDIMPGLNFVHFSDGQINK